MNPLIRTTRPITCAKTTYFSITITMAVPGITFQCYFERFCSVSLYIFSAKKIMEFCLSIGARVRVCVYVCLCTLYSLLQSACGPIFCSLSSFTTNYWNLNLTPQIIRQFQFHLNNTRAFSDLIKCQNDDFGHMQQWKSKLQMLFTSHCKYLT